MSGKVNRLQSIAHKVMKRRSFIKFAIVGVSNLCVSMMTYYGLLFFMTNYQMANIGGFLTGTLNGYYWNAKWVFKTDKKTFVQLLKFYSSYFFTWLLGAVLLYIEVELFHLSEYIVPWLNIFITTPMNYILSKCWTFSKEGSKI